MQLNNCFIIWQRNVYDSLLFVFRAILDVTTIDVTARPRDILLEVLKALSERHALGLHVALFVRHFQKTMQYEV